jgi:hypothetical protein
MDDSVELDKKYQTPTQIGICYLELDRPLNRYAIALMTPKFLKYSEIQSDSG